jgi:hypothetical protein
MSPLVKTKRQANFKDFKRFGAFKGPTSAKKAQFTQERVEYNVFLFNEPLRGSKSLKIFKISLTFRFDSCDFYQNPFTKEKFLKF